MHAWASQPEALAGAQVTANTALSTDAYSSLLRPQHGAAKRER
jgi:hypothetical protein